MRIPSACSAPARGLTTNYYFLLTSRRVRRAVPQIGDIHGIPPPKNDARAEELLGRTQVDVELLLDLRLRGTLLGEHHHDDAPTARSVGEAYLVVVVGIMDYEEKATGAY